MARRADELALLELGHRARDLGLVHVGVGADGLAGHDAVLAERHQHPPFGYADTVALAIDARERLRDQAREHVELCGRKSSSRSRASSPGRRSMGGAVMDRTGVHHGVWPRRLAALHRVRPLSGNMAEDRGVRNGDGRGVFGGEIGRCAAGSAAERGRDGAGPDQVKAAGRKSAGALDGDEFVAGAAAAGSLLERTAPVISSRSTLWNEAAWAKSRDLQ